MEIKHSNNLDRTNVAVAGFVWLFVMVVYYLTKAASFSLWDCGEFIAAGYTLGIPHPPGSPVYVFVARVFSVLPIADDPSVRINLLSSVSSAFTATFCYLAAQRILSRWFEHGESTYSRVLIYGGAASAALFVAFGVTNWTNSVEAEVYGLSMMVLTSVFWMATIYLDTDDSRLRQRLMLASVFLSFLGIGIHMATFLVLPVVAILFILKRSAPRMAWYLVAIFIAAELYYIFALSSRPGEIPFYIPVIILLLVYFFYMFSHEVIPKAYYLVAGGLLLSSLPALGLGIDLLSQRGGGDGVSAGLRGVLDTLGIVAFLGTVGLGAFFAFKWKQGKGSKELLQHYLAAAIFVGVALVMVILMQVPKGYNVFLVLTAISAALLGWAIWKHLNWMYLLAVAAVSIVIIGVVPFVYALGLGLLAVVVLGLVTKNPQWRSALLILVVAIIGYSAHAFIPIRSAQQPDLNENNPSHSLQRTIDFLERKQYGSQGMVERMFVRRAEWTNQFGNYHRMGFWRFFEEQYGATGIGFILFFLLGLFGIWEIVRRTPQRGLPLLLMILVATVGLVLYMNFADGTRQGPTGGHLEVRDRDYFFTPGFVFFGLAIGLGAAVAVQYLRESTREFAAGTKKIVMASGLVLLLLPAFALAKNYHMCDRSNNFIAWHYGHNILQSCEPNAILFTHGDNDTFTLWCLQMVYGIRTDVSVINMALANSKWYLKQVEPHMGVELGWSHEHIDRLQAFHLPDSVTIARRGSQVDGTIYAYLGEEKRILDSLYESFGPPYNSTFRYNAMLVDRIIFTHLGKRPISFSVTGGSDSRRYLGRSIERKCALRGFVWTIEPTLASRTIDVEASLAYFYDSTRFQAPGLGDPRVYKNEATLRLTRNWANSMLVVADSLRMADDMKRAIEVAEFAVESVPYSTDAQDFLARVYAETGEVSRLQGLIAANPSLSGVEHQRILAEAYWTAGDTSQAQNTLEAALAASPADRTTFEQLLRYYFEGRNINSMKTLLERWLHRFPNDAQAAEMLRDLRRFRDSDFNTEQDSQ